MSPRIIEENGLHTIYVIEGRFPDNEETSRHYRGKWCQRSMTPEHFGERHPKHGEDWGKVCPIFREYGANGDCWQKTGVEGFLDPELAHQAFVRLMLKGKKCRDEHLDEWRLVRKRVSVTNTVLLHGRAP